MNFTKMQGTGNDFIVAAPGNDERDWSAVAVPACDRHFGIGGDGLLLVMPSTVADVRMRLFNADGSEAEACGNGIRCLVKYAVDHGLARGTETRVETLAGIRKVRVDPGRGVFQVGMGQPLFGVGEIPVVIPGKDPGDRTPLVDYPVTVSGRRLELSFVSMGNPHAVCFWHRPVADFSLSRLGPKVEHHAMFPKRTNFEVARVLDRRRIEVRVWERGVGETLACGTGACAVAVAAHLHGFIDNKVDITLPGGTLNIEWDGTGEVFLSGPATVVYTGNWISEVKSA